MDGTSSQSANEVLEGLRKGFNALGYLSHVPWMMRILTTLSFLGGPMKLMNEWSNAALIRRKKVCIWSLDRVSFVSADRWQRGLDQPDMMAHLLKHTPNDKQGNELLFADARVLLAAGR